ncbi:hypothetical protein F4677DRAFT_440894 [Hypoxylon crocopeplum]|nr:hypothetical protein F4677DRAFT_440894 [Hypoxylon crocopeplum]
MQQLADQLDSLREGTLKDNRLVLKGLDGVAVDFNLDPGRKILYHDQKHEIAEPYIHYKSIEELTLNRKVVYVNLREAYLPISLDYPTTCSWKHTPILNLLQAFESMKIEWESSEFYGKLQDLLASVQMTSIVRKTIAFSCGDLIRDSKVYDRGIFQHLILLAIWKWFSTRVEGQIATQCYAQDPIYSDQGKEVLAGVGVTVLNDPKAFLETDESSVVMSFCSNAPIKQIITDISRPAIIIWDKVERSETHYLCADSVSSRVADMLSKEYLEMEFPYHKHIGKVSMYVRIEG